MKSMKDQQKQVDEWVSQYKMGYWQPLEIMARLTEETGELARELNHRFGPKKKKAEEDTADLENEAADIIFTLCCLANSLNLDLDRGFKHAMDKCYGRDKDRFEKK
ncbi:MAG: nucleotide pyrophosphohydrolase [Candidatus Yonathbacteria bacterium RIFOXYC1_FULL_52_10]|nr:MAG: nucleotide pyrophosphohydrolase [Candidatus Yonathbacteria bacterium RIFOXYC1_FULL_52_10]